MRAGRLQHRAQTLSIISLNGTGAIGQRWVREWMAMCMRWLGRVVMFMLEAFFIRREPAPLQTLLNGMAALGRRWGQAQMVTIQPYMRWLYRAPICMPVASLHWRAVPRPIISPNGTGAVGQRWARE